MSGRASEPPATIVVSRVLGSVPSSSRRRSASAIRADAVRIRRSMASLRAARSAGAGRSQGFGARRPAGHVSSSTSMTWRPQLSIRRPTGIRAWRGRRSTQHDRRSPGRTTSAKVLGGTSSVISSRRPVGNPLDRVAAVRRLVRRLRSIDSASRPRSNEHRPVAGRSRREAREVLVQPLGDRAQRRVVERVHLRIREPALRRPRIPALPDRRRALADLEAPARVGVLADRRGSPARGVRGRTARGGRARVPRNPVSRWPSAASIRRGEAVGGRRPDARGQQSEPEREGIARLGLVFERAAPAA